jgi:hypothetical protein
MLWALSEECGLGAALKTLLFRHLLVVAWSAKCAKRAGNVNRVTLHVGNTAVERHVEYLMRVCVLYGYRMSRTHLHASTW